MQTGKSELERRQTGEPALLYLRRLSSTASMAPILQEAQPTDPATCQPLSIMYLHLRNQYRMSP